MIALNNIGFKTKHKGLQNLITKMVKQKVNKTYQMIWLGETDFKWKQAYIKQLESRTGRKANIKYNSHYIELLK